MSDAKSERTGRTILKRGNDPINLRHETIRNDGGPLMIKTVPSTGAPDERARFSNDLPSVDAIPDRKKGATAQTYGGQRDSKSKQIIYEQIVDLSEKFFKNKTIEFDEDNFNWVVFDDYYLPNRWKGIARTSPLLISFPMEYPRLPPVGFYLRASLPKSPNGHLYARQYDHAEAIADPEPVSKNWYWYCVFIESGNWKPAPFRRSGDWNRGDNLWDYMTLIGEVLQSDD